MNRTTENVVLCGANSYEQKYYFNPDFAQLPESIRNELQMMCVTFAEEAGGIFTVEFDEKGNIKFTVRVDDGDYLFDEIESGLHISKGKGRADGAIRALLPCCIFETRY